LHSYHIPADSSEVLSTPADYKGFKLSVQLLSLGDPSKQHLIWMLRQVSRDWRCSLHAPILLLHLLRIQSGGCRGNGGPVTVWDLNTVLWEWQQSCPYKY